MIPAWWKLVAILVVALALFGLGWKVYHDVEQHGYGRRIGEEQAQTIRDLRQNEIREANLQAQFDAVKKEKDDEISGINARHVAALNELRNRPTQRRPVSENSRGCGAAPGSGLPGANGAVSQGEPVGATGADLSQPDAAFLLGEAARGNSLRAALKECYGALQQARKAQPAPAPAN